MLHHGDHGTTPPAPAPPTAVTEPQRKDTATTHPLRTEEDLLTVRHAVRAAALNAGFGLVDQTRIVTAASELARNAYVHGGGGSIRLEIIQHSGRLGLRLSVSDQGPGIADLDAAFIDGYTTGAGLGHGLGGARRLMDEFHVRTTPGSGTTITAVRWASDT
ncbi:anti-sigma regulatory factor [Streptomyces ficellus]|uniref:Anti-sigma regulatory factor n=1 Tax=Streptomyces ficellus TaxID=1977088 RepID=A0ABT7Z1G4_9ACTN|nr:anti-sigma regulatory factor [Streptomyces ficellus]MDN3293332.1 anti-sigma regulatory factor [Streptomyces ficellus]